MRTPVVVVSGVDPEAMAAAVVGMAFDLPHAVVVRHEIDVERQVLVRLVSDMTGVVDREEIDLHHACVGCAVREDVVPTIERVARDGRWRTVVVHLPVAASAEQVTNVLVREPRLARHLRVAGVVTALRGETVVEDLLGDDLLRERGRHTAHDDGRGVGEAACGMVERADAVVLVGGADEAAAGLVRTLARPDADVVDGVELLAAELVGGWRYEHRRTLGWLDPTRELPLPEPASSLVWQLDLRSSRPFHPERLLDDLELLGGGRHRSRGCFWLPTRPEHALEWDGAGGQLSIGNDAPWRRRSPHTRIVVTGVGAVPARLAPAFEAMLVQRAESGVRGLVWEATEDGFEPWLGAVRKAA